MFGSKQTKSHCIYSDIVLRSRNQRAWSQTGSGAVLRDAHVGFNKNINTRRL